MPCYAHNKRTHINGQGCDDRARCPAQSPLTTLTKSARMFDLSVSQVSKCRPYLRFLSAVSSSQRGAANCGPYMGSPNSTQGALGSESSEHLAAPTSNDHGLANRDPVSNRTIHARAEMNALSVSSIHPDATYRHSSRGGNRGKASEASMGNRWVGFCLLFAETRRSPRGALPSRHQCHACTHAQSAPEPQSVGRTFPSPLQFPLYRRKSSE